MAVFGLDIGQANDWACLVVAVPEGTRPHSPRPMLAITHLERIPLGTSYTAMVDHVATAAAAYESAGHPVVIATDRTGVGRPVVEQLTTAAPASTVLGITWTAGQRITGQWPTINVPKGRLVDALVVALEQRALRVVPGLPYAEALGQDLRTYRRGAHMPDLLAAAAMATWTADHLAETRAGLSWTVNQPDP